MIIECKMSLDKENVKGRNDSEHVGIAWDDSIWMNLWETVIWCGLDTSGSG
jgi:hypothetical protein